MINSIRLRTVFDCMVFLQGAVWKESPAGICLSLASDRLIELFLSDLIVAEIRNVLLRAPLRSKFPVLTRDFVEEFLAGLQAIATHIVEVPQIFKYARDPKDEPYLNLAVAAHVECLVTRDNDLLDLSNPTDADGERLRELNPGLVIVDPVRFLHKVAGRR